MVPCFALPGSVKSQHIVTRVMRASMREDTISLGCGLVVLGRIAEKRDSVCLTFILSFNLMKAFYSLNQAKYIYLGLSCLSEK